MNEIALDTNVAIELLNGKQEIIKIVQQYDSIYLPVTVCGELLFGAKNSTQKVKNESKYKAFINTCIILDTNELVAETYAEVRLALKTKGKPIPENDIWISALCIVNDIPLASLDHHFINIEFLKLIKAFS